MRRESQIDGTAVLVNLHGDNFGDFINATSARGFAEGELGYRVVGAVSRPGRWQSLPFADSEDVSLTAPPSMLSSGIDVLLHYFRVPHRCRNRAVWRLLDEGLAGASLAISVPCGANIGPYRDWSYLAVFLAAREAGIPTCLLFGTVLGSGSGIYDLVSRRLLRNTILSVRNMESVRYLKKGGRRVVEPVDISVLATRPHSSPNEEFRRHGVVSVVLGDHLGWHPDASGIEGGDVQGSLARAIIESVLASSELSGFSIDCVPHSALQSEIARLDELKRYGAGRVRIRDDIEDYEAYVSAISSSELVVSLRYHGVVVAVANGVPVVGVAYESKTSEFMGNHGLEPFCLSMESLGEESLRAAIALAKASDLNSWNERANALVLEARGASGAFANEIRIGCAVSG